MKTPVEIAEGRLQKCREVVGDIDDITGYDIIAAIEAAGCVIVHPDQVTEEMVDAGVIGFSSTKNYGKELTSAIIAALRSAPKWSKGNEG